MSDLKNQFGAVVQRRRLKAGLSQEELADRAGLHRTHVGKLERGLQMPSILVAKQIADALGLSAGKLLDEAVREPVRKPVKKAKT